MSRYRPFKGTERAVAAALGGKRTGHLGGADVDAGWLSVEVKHRASIPAWLVGAMEQAERNAGVDADGVTRQLPIVVIHQHGGRHVDDLVVLRLGDFTEWFGEAESGE